MNGLTSSRKSDHGTEFLFDFQKIFVSTEHSIDDGKSQKKAKRAPNCTDKGPKIHLGNFSEYFDLHVVVYQNSVTSWTSTFKGVEGFVTKVKFHFVP